MLTQEVNNSTFKLKIKKHVKKQQIFKKNIFKNMF